MGAMESPGQSYDLADAAELVQRALGAFRRPPRISVSDWADQYRRLPSKGAPEPGRWRTARVPYLREIMDCLSESHPAKRVVFMKSVQSGGTECGNNWVGWFIATQRAPMMVVEPTIDSAETWSKQRLNAMIEDTPVLRALVRPARERDASNTAGFKEWPGGALKIAGANSAAGLRQMPVRYLMLDEVDAYPAELEGEGDPVKLAEGRTTAFSRRKVFLVSTPTIESLSRINREWEASDQRRYYIACPECGHRQVLVWDHLQWPQGAPHQARYACAECGSLIGEHHKTTMLATGEWRATYPERTTPGFHINSIYTPIGLGFSWAELAEEYEAAQRDPLKRKAFENLRLGQVTKDPTEKLDWEELRDRADPQYPARAIPRGTLLLTAGIDVQKDRWAVTLLGWARGPVVRVIDWFELPGDPTIPEDWLALEARVMEPIVNSCGVPMRVELAGVDSGYLQDDVLHFTRPRQRRGWFALKGATDSVRPIITRPSKVDYTWRGAVIKGGAQQWQIGVFHAKEWLFTRLARDRDRLPEERLVRFASGLLDMFFVQLCAEVYDSTKRRFVKTATRNEGLDTVLYAIVAGMHPALRVQAWQEPRWTQRESSYEPVGRDLFAIPAEASAVQTYAMEAQPVAEPAAARAMTVEQMIAIARQRAGT